MVALAHPDGCRVRCPGQVLAHAYRHATVIDRPHFPSVGEGADQPRGYCRYDEGASLRIPLRHICPVQMNCSVARQIRPEQIESDVMPGAVSRLILLCWPRFSPVEGALIGPNLRVSDRASPIRDWLTFNAHLTEPRRSPTGSRPSAVAGTRQGLTDRGGQALGEQGAGLVMNADTAAQGLDRDTRRG
jgi:hypothetical protein